MPRRSSVASMRASISDRATPRFSRPNASSSRTVSFDAESWFAGVAKTIPTRPSRASGAAPAVAIPSIVDPALEPRPDDARDEPGRRQRKGGLPGTGPAGHADPLARPDRELDIDEDRLRPARIADAEAVDPQRDGRRGRA